MSEWISVENMPIDGHYLCCCNDIVSSWQEVLVCWGAEWFTLVGDEYAPIVTHWAPLPAPPKSK